jgi:SAM-dependent methyltransferase
MGFYARVILPRVTHAGMSSEELVPYRTRVLAGARGRVLEIGIGSGRNLPLYGAAVQSVTGVDPSVELVRMAEKAAGRARVPVDFLVQSAEALPLASESFDTAVTTWTLCTIPDPARALREVRRVLKPDGRLLFVEHGHAPEPGVAAWQRRLEPFWMRVFGGCHLTVRIDELLRDAGYDLEELRTGYGKGPRPLSFMYRGVARPA